MRGGSGHETCIDHTVAVYRDEYIEVNVNGGSDNISEGLAKNGAALCPFCNLRSSGDRMVVLI